jgi:hypothetical protein
MRSKPPITALMLVAIAAYLLGVPTVVLWLSGDWHWVEGWIFGLWFAAFFGACLLWLYYKDPALLAERFRRPGSGGQSRSDLVILIGVKVGAIAWFVLPPLDRRFAWMPRLPLWNEICGTILLLGGSFYWHGPPPQPLEGIEVNRGGVPWISAQSVSILGRRSFILSASTHVVKL